LLQTGLVRSMLALHAACETSSRASNTMNTNHSLQASYTVLSLHPLCI